MLINDGDKKENNKIKSRKLKKRTTKENEATNRSTGGSRATDALKNDKKKKKTSLRWFN